MFYKLCIVFVAAISFDYTNCETRDELTNRYTGIFNHLSVVAYNKAEEARRQYVILANQIMSQRKVAETTIESYRNDVRETMRQAKTDPNVTAKALDCLKTPQHLVGRLFLDKPLSFCDCLSETVKLGDTRGKYGRLGSLASKTVTFCTELNPFETQDESFDECLRNKVPDLKQQFKIVQNEYDGLINTILQCNTNCLANRIGDFLGRGNYIRYRISACALVDKFSSTF